jgi:hypothetical protein
VRSYRIRILPDPAGARVVSASLKMETQHAKAMAKDVETWAKGGSGCALAALFPPPAEPKSDAAPKVKKKPKRSR